MEFRVKTKHLMQRKLENKMAHKIDFENLTEIQNNQSLMEEVENEEMKKFLSSLLEGIELFQDNNDVQPKTETTTKDSNIKVKTRNLLTNVSSRGYKPEDVEKTNLFIDVLSFLKQKLNPTGLDRKLEILLERDYVKMIWDSCVPHK